MSNKTLTIVNILMAILVVFLFCVLMFKSCGHDVEPTVETHSDTVYLTSVDTFYIPKDSIIYKEKKVLDTIYVRDTILIREQKYYQDSFSAVWISGIEPEIDSIKHFIPRDTVIITNETTQTVVKKKHWSQFVGVGASVGYGVSINQSPTFSPFVGVTVTYGFGYTW